MTANEGGYFRIPNGLMRRRGRNLTIYEIGVYTVLAMYANREGKAWPTQETIGKMLNINRETVRESVRALEGFGYLKTINRGHRRSKLYQLTADFYRPDGGGAATGNGGGVATIHTQEESKQTRKSRAPPRSPLAAD